MRRRCPVCNKLIRTNEQDKAKRQGYFPFCSERCKLIDLGEWLDARYRISSELPDESSDRREDKL